MAVKQGIFAEEIQRLMKLKGLRQVDLVEKLKRSKSYISQILLGHRSFALGTEFSKAISAVLGVQESHWVKFTTEGKLLPTLHPVDSADTVPIQDWGEVSAGEPRPQTEPKTVRILKALVPNSSGTLVMFRVRGHSMTKRFIHEGSLVFVRIDPAPSTGEKVVAVVNSRKKRGPRGYVVKVLKKGSEWLELHSASEEDAAEPMIVDDTVEIIGVVEGILNT
jgi:SOS-response transcriptional repressor LexA